MRLSDFVNEGRVPIGSESLVRVASSPPPPFIEHMDDTGWPETSAGDGLLIISLSSAKFSHSEDTMNIDLLATSPIQFHFLRIRRRVR